MVALSEPTSAVVAVGVGGGLDAVIAAVGASGAAGAAGAEASAEASAEATVLDGAFACASAGAFGEDPGSVPR